MGKSEIKTRQLLISLILGLALALGLLWLLGTAARADATPIHCVTPTGNDTGDCAVTPCRSVQYAVDQAGDGDTVKVAAGTYSGVYSRLYDPGYGTPYVITQVVYISKSLTIQGGYTTADWTTSDPSANPTTLDAEGNGRVFYVGPGITVTLEGLQIVNGTFDGDGGGVFGSDSHLTIRNCTISNNTSSHNGGGIYLFPGTLFLDNSRIVSNTAGVEYGGGGGVYARGAMVTATHNLFQDNKSADGGGGVEFYECTAYVTHNTFQGNASTERYGSGGGLSARWGDLIVTDNVFYNNIASTDHNGHGGGLYLCPDSGHTYTVTDNLIQDNVAASNSHGYGGGAYLTGDGWVAFSRNQVLDNVASHGGEGMGGGLLVGSRGLLSDNLIQGNWATTVSHNSGRGGGVRLKGYGIWLESNRILDNHAVQYGGYNYTVEAYGGGVFISNQSIVTMTNNIVAGNWYCEQCGPYSATVYRGGGGVYIGGQTTPAVTYVHLAHNTIADNQSPALFSESAGLTMNHNILYGHTTDLKTIMDTSGAIDSLPPNTVADYTLWYSSMDVEQEDGTFVHNNDFIGAPDFVSASLDSYHLGPNSQAIDKGPGVGVTTDIDGNVRPIGAGYDLGADEYTGVDLSPSTKSASPQEAGAGEVVTFTIVLRNRGATNAGNTVLFDAIPAATTYVTGSVQATSGTVTDTGGIGWTGTVAPGAAVTIIFQVTVNQETLIKNTAVVTDGYGTTTTLTAWVNANRIYMPLVMRGYAP